MNHLGGKHILLTRTAKQNKTTAELVQSLGAIPELLPCTSIEVLEDNIQRDWLAMQTNLPSGSDVIFSSRNGVEAVAHYVTDFEDVLSNYRTIAVGKKTAASLESFGVKPAWSPHQASQKGLIKAYEARGLPEHVLFFRAETGNDCLLNFLDKHGVRHQLSLVYRSVCSTDDASETILNIKNNTIDAVLLGSARTAEFYVAKIGDLSLANRPVVVVMSPQVRKATDKLGLNVQIIAHKPSFRAMLEGLNRYFEHHK